MRTCGLQKTLLPDRVEPVGYTLAMPIRFLTHGHQKTLLLETVEPAGYTLAMSISCQQIIGFHYVLLKLDALLKLDSNNCGLHVLLGMKMSSQTRLLQSKPHTHE